MSRLFSYLTLALLTLAALSAAEPPLTDLLRQGLYAEEVSRDPAAAAAQYEQILARFQGQQAIAATALFRLAEVRRQQDKKADAIKLYQQLLTDFPKAEAEAKLARQHLTELGGKIPEAGMAVVDEEELEIARLTQLKTSSPDLARNDQSILEAIKKHQTRVVKWLIDSGLVAADTGAVVAAVEAGDLRILNLLLDAGIHSGASTAVFKAAELGYAEIEKALLEKASEKCVSGGPQALAQAVKKGYLGIVRAHLDGGVDPNWQPEQCVIPRNANLRDFEWEGTPLITAIANNRMEFIELLLKANADVKLKANTTGVTVLHAAAHLKEPAATDLTARLIALGADPNAVTLPLTWVDSATLSILSPLQYAVLYENWACAKALIRHGANVKQPGLFDPFLVPGYGAFGSDPERQVPTLEFLLANGADPNVPNAKDKPPLFTIIKQGNAELLKFFLKHGADANVKLTGWKRLREPGHGDPFAATTGKWEEIPGSLLDCVSSKDPKVALEIIGLLLDAGAKADGCLGSVLSAVAKLDEDGALVRRLLAQRPDFINLDEVRDLRDWQPASRRIFLDEVLIPALAKDGRIQLLNPETGKWQSLATPAAEPLPSTPALLLANSDALLPKYDVNHPAPFSATLYVTNYYWPVLTLVRTTANGSFERQALDLTGDQPLPALQPGDVLELARSAEPAVSNGEGFRNQSAIDSLKTTLTWHLRKRISFPVTIALDGQTREFKLRGDLLTFDPTKNEAPLLTAGRLAWLLLPAPIFDASHMETPILTIQRKGAADLRMDLSAAAAHRFELQVGDHLILPDSKQVMPQTSDSGMRPIWLVTPGFPYRRGYSAGEGQSTQPPNLKTLPPTLLQLLTDAYFPHDEPSPFLENGLDESAWPKLMKHIQNDRAPAVPPHPDFAHLRIKRTDANGIGVVLEINLTDAIRRCTDATPAADARKDDVELQPGDVVELPLKTDLLTQPWNGFSAEEERFFRKALGGFVTLKTGDGIIEQQEILYHQPEWRQTPHGLMSLPPKQGVASTRATHVSQRLNFTRMMRGDNSLLVLSAFVRDGDHLFGTEGSRVRVPGPIEPRKSVVSPPPGR